MFRSLEEAIQDMERSKREVEARIKARALSVYQEQETVPETPRVPAIRVRVKAPRFRVEGRTIYTSGSRYSRK
jgi:hypothetical protein